METRGLPPSRLHTGSAPGGKQSDAARAEAFSLLLGGPCHRPAKLRWGGRWSLWLRSQVSVCQGPLTCACFLMVQRKLLIVQKPSSGKRPEGTQISLVIQTLHTHLDSEPNSLE